MISVSSNSLGAAAVERLGLFRKECEGCATVLDLGCGMADLMKELRFPGRRLVGLEVWEPYVVYDRASFPDMEFILGDAQELSKLVPRKSFDVVICSDVLEHLPLAEAERLIVDLENVAIKKAVFFIPVGVHEQPVDPWIDRLPTHQPNPYQTHHSVWLPSMMDEKGYSVIYWSEYHPPQPFKERGAMFCTKIFSNEGPR